MPNHAAAPAPNPSLRRCAIRAALAAGALTLLAAPAFALDGIDLSEPVEPVAEGECPRLIQIKYPFLSCANGQIGQSDESDTWESARRMPLQSDWNEGPGYWGPSLNAD